MLDLLGKLNEMKQKMEEAKVRLASIVVSGNAGDGAVKVEMNGNSLVKNIFIENDLMELSRKEELQDLLKNS